MTHLCNVLHNYGDVRIVTGGDPRLVMFNVMVQVFVAQNKWRDVRGFNSISNDYAYTSAREYAEELAQEPDEGES
jgi:hypothetical protein